MKRGRRNRSRGSRSNKVVVLRTPSVTLLAKSNIPTTGLVAKLHVSGDDQGELPSNALSDTFDETADTFPFSALKRFKRKSLNTT
jgi:hypothetical protein